MTDQFIPFDSDQIQEEIPGNQPVPQLAKNKKLIPLMIIAILLVASLGVFIGFTKNWRLINIHNTPTEETQSEWLEFKGKYGDYSFKYPAVYEIEDQSDQPVNLSEKLKLYNGDQPINKIEFRAVQAWYPDYPEDSRIIGNHQFWYVSGENSIMVMTERDHQKIFEFNFYGTNNFDDSLVQQILATFSLNHIQIQKVENYYLGIKLDYPNTWLVVRNESQPASSYSLGLITPPQVDVELGGAESNLSFHYLASLDQNPSLLAAAQGRQNRIDATKLSAAKWGEINGYVIDGIPSQSYQEFVFQTATGYSWVAYDLNSIHRQEIEQMLSSMKLLEIAKKDHEYQNQQLGFALDFPASWAGKYKVNDVASSEFGGAEFVYLSAGEPASTLFTILVYPTRNYQQLSQRDKDSCKIVLDTSEKIYCAVPSLENPYNQSANVQEYQELMSSYQQIISSVRAVN
ncbi:MAG: hypothetical protein ABII10_00810 [Candidatus Paceibacterota bacterium]